MEFWRKITFLMDLSFWTGSAKRCSMLWSQRDLFSMAQAAQVYSKSTDNGKCLRVIMAWQLTVIQDFVPSLGASHWNDCLLSPIHMKLLVIAKRHALIPYIWVDCFSNILEGFSWVTLWKKEKQSQPFSGVNFT